MRYELYVSQKYFRSRKGKSIIQRISVFSILTVVIAVAMPIIVLSIVNGLHQNIGEKLIAYDFHLRLEAKYEDFSDYDKVIDYINKQYSNDIELAMPYFSSVGMLRKSDLSSYYSSYYFSEQVVVRAVRQKDIEKNRRFQKEFVLKTPYGDTDYETVKNEAGKEVLRPTKFNLNDVNTIYLGETLFSNINAVVNGDVELTIPLGDIVSDLDFKKMKVKGIFSGGFAEYDKMHCIIPLEALSEIFEAAPISTGIGLYINDNVNINKLTQIMQNDENLKEFEIVNTETQGIFRDFYREKRIMRYVLFIIIIAAFMTIYITLHVIVMDKRREIGILKSFGTTSKSIQRIFLIEGALIGIIGSVIGAILGILITNSMTEIILFVEDAATFVKCNLYFGGGNCAPVQIMSSDVFFISVFPKKLYFWDIMIQCAGAIFVSIIAAYFPSKRASKEHPAHVLRQNV